MFIYFVIQQIQCSSLNPLEVEVCMILAGLNERGHYVVPDIHAVFFDAEGNAYIVMDLVRNRLCNLCNLKTICDTMGRNQSHDVSNKRIEICILSKNVKINLFLLFLKNKLFLQVSVISNHFLHNR